MVSHWLSCTSRMRCGNSIVSCPPSARRICIPDTKSLRSGTWASTLFPISRSALESAAREVAVVGGHLDHPAGFVQVEAIDHGLDIAARMLQPGRGVRGEVRVLAEDALRGLELLELDEQAALADQRAQRIERLHPVGLLGCQVGVRERRHAEVGEDGVERRRTEPAGRAHAGEPRWASTNESICASVTSRTSRPSRNAMYQATIESRAGPRAHAGAHPSRSRAFVESSARCCAS